ncbi:MAG TPA: hypothetical protein DEH78_06940 [Solibacterales bacterium]|nr:hypothetical protein [Bryobacterales bacterium]
MLVAEVKLHYDRFILVSRGTPPMPGLDEAQVLVMSGAGDRKSVHLPGRDVPGIYSFIIRDAAGSPSGRLAVSGSAWDVHGRAAAMLVIYSQGNPPLIVRTHPLMCNKTAFDADDQLWCLASDIEKFNARSTDYNLVAKFSPSGVLLGQYLPRADFPVSAVRFAFKAPESDGRHPAGDARIYAGRGCVDVWLPNVSTAIRLGADGTEQSRRPIEPTDTNGLAFDSECRASRIERQPETRNYRILRLTEQGWSPPGASTPENLIGGHELLAVQGNEAVVWNFRNLLAYYLPLTSDR